MIDLNRLAGKRVFVGGGAGFVGSAVVRRLVELAVNVLAFDSFLHGSPENLKGVAAQLIHGDACDMAHLTKCMQAFQPNFVISCIGDTFVTTAYHDPLRFFRNNVAANYNILQVAQDCAVSRVVYVSSAEVYGPHGELPVHEGAPLNPVNSYAVSKLAADRLCWTRSVETACPVVIARIFNCYGPRETHAYIIPEIIHQLHLGQHLVLGNLLAARDFTFVEDTAEALLALLLANINAGEAVNVGSGTAVSVKTLVAQIADIMQVKNLTVSSDARLNRRCDIELFLCDNKRLQALTGWVPRVGLAEGLAHTVNWFKQNGSAWPWPSSDAERSAHTRADVVDAC